MIQSILRFLGIGSKPKEVETEVVTTTASKPAPIPVPIAAQKKRKRHAPQKQSITKSSVNAKKYYKRGGRFYSTDDDCLIEDVLMLVVLAELFDDGDIVDMDVAVESTAPPEDLLDIDVSETPVVEAPSYTPPEPSYTPEPEPVKQDSYSSGSSYGSGSSDYDSGGSDSGGGDD